MAKKESVTDEELENMEKQIEQKVEKEKKAEAQPPAPDPAPAPTPADTSSPPTEEPPPEQEQFNASEWVKKKGWKTPEDAAKSVRELEKQFHEKNEELRRERERNLGYMPPAPAPGYSPGYYTPEYQQPSYAPPPNPYMPPPPAPYYAPPSRGTADEERIAASYGMTVDDFRRVLAVSNDLNAITRRQLESEFNNRLQSIQSQNEKNNDLSNLIGDPAFHNDDVKYEVHEILSKNPSIFSGSKPYSTALNMALMNMGRRNLSRGIPSSGYQPPSEPPKTAGSGYAGGNLPGRRIGGVPSMKEMEGKSVEELEKILKSQNAYKTYADMA